MSFTFSKLDIPDILFIQSRSFADKRGFFSEVYREEEFSRYGIGPFVQENYSCSIKNVVRGLHYQSNPHPVGKLVSCPHGQIWDVVVDIRKKSPTFGKWTATLLENGNGMLWIPPGFAHGFCVLSPQANVLYRQTEYYNKECDRSIRWDDPDINIRWPIDNPILSDKDYQAKLLSEADLL